MTSSCHSQTAVLGRPILPGTGLGVSLRSSCAATVAPSVTLERDDSMQASRNLRQNVRSQAPM